MAFMALKSPSKKMISVMPKLEQRRKYKAQQTKIQIGQLTGQHTVGRVCDLLDARFPSEKPMFKTLNSVLFTDS